MTSRSARVASVSAELQRSSRRRQSAGSEAERRHSLHTAPTRASSSPDNQENISYRTDAVHPSSSCHTDVSSSQHMDNPINLHFTDVLSEYVLIETKFLM